MDSAHLSCQILMKLNFYRKILEKYINSLTKILLVVAEIFHARRTDGQRETEKTKIIK
jgi:hypothetical protein